MNFWRLASCVVACVSLARTAAAHAPPQANGIQWTSSEAGERMLVRTNRGLIVAEPADGAFRMLCNDAFDVSLSEVPPVIGQLDGSLILGTYASGLVRSSVDLCGYEAAPSFAGLYPIALESDPSGVLYAAVLPYDGSSAALLKSEDQGQTVSVLTEVPGAPTALRLAPSDPSRLYVSITTADGNLSFGSLLSSTDGGATFAEHSVELEASELRVFLLDVAPDDPELVFVRTQSRDGLTPERLLRSADGGKTFEAVLAAPGPLSAVVAADGDVWAGAADGLYRSEDRGRSFAPVKGTDLNRIGCLAVHQDRLYACGYSAGEFGVQLSRLNDAAFQWFLRFPQVTERLDCPAESDERKLCDFAFADWVAEQGVEADASPGDEPDSEPESTAGASSAVSSAKSPGEPAGCQLTYRGTYPASLAGAPLALLAALLRQRRSRRGGSSARGR